MPAESSVEKIYHDGYKQGQFDALFDLRAYLDGAMLKDLSTGELSDPISPDNKAIFEEMGLRWGQRNKNAANNS